VKTALALKNGSFCFKPSRRVDIPKTEGKIRTLSISSPREKIVQKALHSVLEAIFEPIFLPSSHGFRPKKSVHSALLDVYLKGKTHNWVIQGDISKCFDRIPHNIIMKRIGKLIGDPRFLEMIRKFLSAGHLDPQTGHLVKSSIGTPQGGVLSPLLANIVLHELDNHLANLAIKFNKGTKRRKNPAYASMAQRRYNSDDRLIRKQLLDDMRKIRRSLMNDPTFRRMIYIRYADDFIVLVTGSLKDSEFIKLNIKDYLLSRCGIELNEDKTSITNINKK
jgi:group II intron reverse transcriptase/maturase